MPAKRKKKVLDLEYKEKARDDDVEHSTETGSITTETTSPSAAPATDGPTSPPVATATDGTTSAPASDADPVDDETESSSELVEEIVHDDDDDLAKIMNMNALLKQIASSNYQSESDSDSDADSELESDVFFVPSQNSYGNKFTNKAQQPEIKRREEALNTWDQAKQFCRENTNMVLGGAMIFLAMSILVTSQPIEKKRVHFMPSSDSSSVICDMPAGRCHI